MYILKKSTLNPEQYEAVTHRDGPILVLAGAGSGKTRVITHRIASMVSDGIDPSSIVAVSFTNKAANEMRERVAELIGEKLARKCVLSTFHALGAEILRRDIDKLGYRTPYAIMDVGDQRAIVRDILAELKLGSSRADPRAVLAIISKAKMKFTDPSALPGMRFNPLRRVIGKVYSRYQAALRALNGVDFDDLIGLPVELFKNHPDVLARYHRTWDYLMVDEYQDTNDTQFQLLNALAAAHENVMVVGDDDQSIYGFRGAVPDHILSFDKHFPNAKVVALEQNYRSTKTVLEAANAVIAQNTTRHVKNLWSDGVQGEKLRWFECQDEREEALMVADQIEEIRSVYGHELRDFAILYRTNPQSRTFEESLREKNFPYRIVGGTNFYDRSEVRDVIFYLRSCANLRDDLAMRRIVNTPRRGIGATLMARIDNIARRDSCPFFEAMQKAHTQMEWPSTRTRDKLQELVALLQELKRRFADPTESLSDLARELMTRINYIEHLRSQGSNELLARRRVQNVEDLLDSLTAYEARGGSSLSGFLERIALEPSSADDNESDDNVITLMTFHSSKGLEYPVVFMVGCEEGLLPHEQSMKESGGPEEERRLCYVGITRAKERLILTSCESRTRHGESQRRKPSRFLKEIPEGILERSDDPESNTAKALKEKQQERTRDHLAALRAAIFND